MGVQTTQSTCRLLTLVGGVSTLLSYAWMIWVAPNRTAVQDTTGGLLQVGTWARAAWTTSTFIATVALTIGLGMLCFDSDVRVQTWNDINLALLLFFGGAASWTTVAYHASLHRLPRWFAAVPVWVTAFGNLLVIAYVEETALQALWGFGAFHHIVLDGVIWSQRYIQAPIQPFFSSYVGSV